MPRKNKVVMVEWEDAWNDNDKVYDEIELLVARGMTMFSVGLLVKSDKHGVVICGEWNEETQTFRSAQFIPKGMIRKVVTLH